MATVTLMVGSWVGSTLLGSAALATVTTTVISGAIVGAVVGATVGGLTALVTGGDIGKGVLNGAVGGAVSGSVFGLASGIYQVATTPATSTIAATGEGMSGVETVVTDGATMSEVSVGTDAAGGLNVEPTGGILKTSVDGAGKVSTSALNSSEVAQQGILGKEAVNVDKGSLGKWWDGASDMTQQAALQGVSGVASGLLDNSGDIADDNMKAQLAMNESNNIAMQERQDAASRDRLAELWEMQNIREHEISNRSDTQQRLTIGA